MHETLEEEVRRVIANMDNEQSNQEQEPPGTTEQEKESAETIHIHYFPDAIVITPDPTFGNSEEASNIVDTTLAVTTTSISEIEQLAAPPPTLTSLNYFAAISSVGLYLFLIFSCIAFQAYEILNPPIATVTIFPKAQTVTLTGTLKLGRVLQPLTISQSQTTPTTGKGHQDAKAATGFITFYNGLFTSQTIAAGAILTGADGIQIITDQEALIPAGNPPSYGQVTVSAHAINPGVRGNIPAYDISQACCSSAVLAKDPQPFTGGQDERDFSTVSTQDIHKLSTPIKTSVMQSMSAALQSQLTPQEQLYVLPCTPQVASDHSIGTEATQVKVTVSEMCSEVAYNREAVERKATDLLNRQAVQKIGIGYSLFGNVQVSVKQATIQKNVILSFHASGTWIYALSYSAQQHIKELIAGKTKSVALRELLSLPGVERAVIGWGDDTRLPKNSKNIHIILFVV